MMDMSPSKGFMEKMKASHGKAKKKSKFGRSKMKAKAKKGFAAFGKKPEMADDEEME
jgi:hypothetical protein